MTVALITTREEELADFKNGLEEHGGLGVNVFGSGQEALAAAQGSTFVLAVVDEGLPDMPPLELVVGFMGVNAMINTAVISGMDHKTFHDQSEGLGVLLQLPVRPAASDAATLVKLLAQANGV